jgi:hypothetical protein
MKNNIYEFIKKVCDGESKEYFFSTKERTFNQIKVSLSSDIFSQNLDRQLEIKIARVASPIIKKINQIEKNRFWIIYYRLCERLIYLKCNQCKSPREEILCIEYILNRTTNHIKAFNIDTESTIFKQVRENLYTISSFYEDSTDIELDRDFKDFKYTTNIVSNYTKKIVMKYALESTDIETIEALIENAILDTNGKYKRENFSIEISYIERELLSYFDKNKKDINKILPPLLRELLYQEKFFNYIYNHFINHRFIDFVRSIKLPPPQTEDVEWIGRTLDEVLGEYTDIISDEVKLILRLKIAERLEDREFIKLLYLFDYRGIDIFSHFEDNEILEIKFYARNGKELSKNSCRKISKVREKLESNSYVVIEDIKRDIVLKLIFPDEMSAKEIGMLLGYREKQIYKKIENAKKRIKYKKELRLCKKV